MPFQARVFPLIAASMLAFAGCSQTPPENPASSSAKTAPKAVETPAGNDTCKDFPVPIYPSHTSLQCETGTGEPLRQTAYIQSADSVEKVAAYYRAEAPSAGWTPDPPEVDTATHAVVSLKKGKGYASVVINADPTGGSRMQIHAYPNGNE